jgi:hypothetical protein
MPATSYRIASRLGDSVKKDLTLVSVESQFARSMRDLFAYLRPRRIIETGTYRGTGTTTIIASAIHDLEIENAQFISIEVNPGNVKRAQENLAKAGLQVEVINGLSVPRALLPTMEQIEREMVHSVIADGLVVDHEESRRAELYFRETDFAALPDDVLGQVLRRFDHRPDVVLLDSGGHMGYVEFRYVVDQLRGPCNIVLDDIYHVKHFRSFQDMKMDPRFEIVAASEEKFGFCVARFNPNFDA